MNIALNTYSLRNEWEMMKAVGGYGPIVRFIKMLGVTEIELLDRSFNSDPATLKEVQAIFEENGLHIFSLGPHANPLTDERNRKARVEELNGWTDVAAAHGVPMYRVALGGGKYSDPAMKPSSADTAVAWITEVLRPVVDHAEAAGVTLAIETHHQFSSNPEFQQKLLDAVPSKHLGFAYDIGNFENDEIRWASLDVLTRKGAVKYVHAKAYAFDEGGFETTLDYPRAVKVLFDRGFEDINLSIEWEGRLAGPLGALRTAELCKYSIHKALGKDYSMTTAFPDEETLMEDLLG
ncbi:MAG: sugar phosphate isomerase/epimerase [Candidatus Lokiarchaeota archaeon]|nr:sugar phosphate isomerase/epimerase [Candidatus Lokiarchaeota archaeon]